MAGSQPECTELIGVRHQLVGAVGGMSPTCIDVLMDCIGSHRQPPTAETLRLQAAIDHERLQRSDQFAIQRDHQVI